MGDQVTEDDKLLWPIASASVASDPNYLLALPDK